MDELEDKMKAFLIAKIESGEETGLSVHDAKGLNIIIENGKLMISDNITTSVSEQTLKELFSFRSHL